MKLKYTLIALCMLGGAAFAQHKSAKSAAAVKPMMGKSPADYVDLYIGSINPKNGSTAPVIKAPGGNMSIFPMFNPAIEDFYLSDKIFGFPMGFGNLMVSSGTIKTVPARMHRILTTTRKLLHHIITRFCWKTRTSIQNTP